MNATTGRPLTAGRLVAVLGICAALTLGAGIGHCDDVKDGKSALQAGRLDEALKSFEKAAQQGIAAGRAGVGQVHLRRRQYEKAMEAFELAQKMDPGLALAYWGQAEVLRRQDKCAEAIPLFRKATELDRKFPDAQLSLGDCLVESKEYEKAVAVFSEGLKWGPKWAPRFLVGLGTAEMSRDSLRDAGIYFTRAREQAPDDPAVRRALGDFYLQRGTWSLAILEYQAAVALDSTDVELRYALAQALYYDKRYDEALVEYRWVTNADPEFALGQLGIGNLLYLAGAADPKRYAEARPALEKYTELEPEDAKGWSLLGRTYYSLKLKDEALVAMVKAQELGDKTKDMYNTMGKAYSERKEWDKALEAFAKGDPGPKEDLVIAQIFVFKSASDPAYVARADSIYRRIVNLDSTSAMARFALSEIGKLEFREAAKTGDFARPLATFQRRISLDPSNGEAYYYVGLSYKELKQYPEALAALQRAAAIDSAKADRFFWLGVLYDAQKQIPEARQAFQRSTELDSLSKLSGKAYRQLGFYMLLDKDWSGAVGRLERAVQLDDRDVQAWVWLGQGYQNSGDRKRAMDAYRKALELDPNQAEANKGVKVLSASTTSGKGGDQ